MPSGQASIQRVQPPQSSLTSDLMDERGASVSITPKTTLGPKRGWMRRWFLPQKPSPAFTPASLKEMGAFNVLGLNE